MIPEDFFKTCELLLKHGEEPHLRTAVGRAYYATFLFFRDYLKQHGLSKTKQPRNAVHAFVMDCLSYSKVVEASIAAVELRNLRQIRHDADYDLDRQITKRDAEDALALGRSILETFNEGITPELTTNLIQNATAYAKQKCWVR